jgi:ketosteroid isomerase-like protein
MMPDGHDESVRHLVLAALDDPVAWPATAATLYTEDVRWHCPARQLAIQGRQAVLARIQADAALLVGARTVTLRQSISGERVIHESAATLVIPAGGVDGVPLEPGTLVELNCTRVMLVRDGRICDERVLQTWTSLAV